MTETTTLTVEEYQRRTGETQTESALNPTYLAFGLLAECGEVAGVYAKMIRDHGGELNDTVRDMFKKEIGDVYWFCARQYDRAHIEMPNNTHRYGHIEDAVGSIVQSADEILFSQSWLPARVIFAANGLCALLDLDPIDVMQANLDKLADRKARGVIGGSGNDR